MRHHLLPLVCLLTFLPAPLFADSQPPKPRLENDELTAREVLTNARGLGLANAMTASAAGTAAIYHNPAAIASAVMYTFDAGYTYDNAANGHTAQVNVVDMKSNEYVGAGLGIVYQYASPQETRHLVQTHLAVAVPLADNLLSLGVSAVYNYMKYDDKKFMSQFTMDAGLILRPLSWLSLGVSMQNLIVGDFEAYMPRMISAGISAGSLELGLSVMFETSFNLSAGDIAASGSYGVGIEYTLKQFIPIRVGYRYESDDHHVIAAGLGYRNKEAFFGIDIGYQHHFKYDNDIVSAALDFYF